MVGLGCQGGRSQQGDRGPKHAIRLRSPPRRLGSSPHPAAWQDAQTVAAELRSKHGISAAHYHADLEPAAREAAHTRWSAGELQASAGAAAGGWHAHDQPRAARMSCRGRMEQPLRPCALMSVSYPCRPLLARDPYSALLDARAPCCPCVAPVLRDGDPQHPARRSLSPR